MVGNIIKLIGKIIMSLFRDAQKLTIDQDKKSGDRAWRTPTQSSRATRVQTGKKKKNPNKDLEPWEWEDETPPWEK